MSVFNYTSSVLLLTILFAALFESSQADVKCYIGSTLKSQAEEVKRDVCTGATAVCAYAESSLLSDTGYILTCKTVASCETYKENPAFRNVMCCGEDYCNAGDIQDEDVPDYIDGEDEPSPAYGMSSLRAYGLAGAALMVTASFASIAYAHVQHQCPVKKIIPTRQ